MIVSPFRFGSSNYRYPLDFKDFTIGDKVRYIEREWDVTDVTNKSITIKAIKWDNRIYTLKKTIGIYPISIQKFGGGDRKY